MSSWHCGDTGGRYSLYAREDYVEQERCIVEPALNKNMPIYPYAPNTRRPDEVERVSPAGGRQNPAVGRKSLPVRARLPDDNGGIVVRE
jgi:hypothetical protein